MILNHVIALLLRTHFPTISHLSSTSVRHQFSCPITISHSMQGVFQVVLASDHIESGFLDLENN